MITFNRIFKLIAFLSLFNLLLQSISLAGTIQKIKNGKVLISLDGTNAQIGDQFYGLSSANKKTALIEITTVKGDKAIARIIKGKPEANDTILIKGSPVEAQSPESKSTFIRHDMKKIALNLKLSSDVISTLQQDTNAPTPNKETVEMKGTNFGINGMMNIPLGKFLSVEGFVGYELLKVTGTALRNVCDGKTSQTCTADISYLTLGALARYNYASGSMNYWAGAGFGLKQPISKSSTALTLDNISLANSVIVAFGLDYHLSNSQFIPISFEYHKSFNESDTVPVISHIAVLAGYGFLY